MCRFFHMKEPTHATATRPRAIHPDFGYGFAGPEVFNNLCGLKTRSFNLSANEVDTTIPSCTNPGDKVQKTSRPGIVNRAFTGSGAFVSSASMSAFMTHVIDATVFDAKVLVPGLGARSPARSSSPTSRPTATWKTTWNSARRSRRLTPSHS
jgi:hypothetical protein